MPILSKIILFILSSICLFFLVFFTFITASYDSSIQNNYTTLNSWSYIVTWEYPNFSIKEWSSYNNELTMFNISTWNNIYYYQWDIQHSDSTIQLGIWTYYFYINSLDFNKDIIINGSVIKPQWPWSFIVNTDHKSQQSIFSISSKVEVNLHDPNNTSKEWTILDLYPNMYVMFNSKLNKQIINADLLRIQNVQYLDMINSFLYDKKTDSTWKSYYDLHEDIKKYVFFEKENKYDFIKEINSINNYQVNIYKQKFIPLSKNNLYNFPGEKYIIKYYSYFQNKEKKKIYTKNLILKELIMMINSGQNNLIDSIYNQLWELKQLDENEYNSMMNTIFYYYENILYSQHKSPETILNIDKLIKKINNDSSIFKYYSLLTLRNIYEEYHNENITNLHKSLNTFVDQHESEMNMSIYNENHRIHSYFLFFIKNILIADFSKVEDHNYIITLFKKYIDIKNIFIEKWNDVTKKTALFDNAKLLKVFVNITKVNFFEPELDDKWLLILLKPAGITNKNSIILQNNINKLLDFYKEYQYFIENSPNRKDKILRLSYNKYIEKLWEYFLAMNDYNEYVLKYDKAALNPTFEVETNENILSIEQAILFLKQFNWVSSIDTNIQIRDYWYCVQPIEKNDVPVENPQDWYCFKVENLVISWYVFQFILIPSDKNTIKNLLYKDLEGNETSIGTNYVMDQIQEDMFRKHSAAQSREKDKYDYKQFFKNNFINTKEETLDNSELENENNEFIPPDSSKDTFQVRKIKSSLLSNNSYLAKIRNIIPITYDYLLLIREDDKYNGKIFPTDFQINVKSSQQTMKFFGKFQWDYNYWASDENNTFDNVLIYLKHPNNFEKLWFLLDKTPIHIDGTFKVTQTENVLEKFLLKYWRVEFIYTSIKNNLSISDIYIKYDIEKNIVYYTLNNWYSLEYNMEWMVKIIKDSNEIQSIVYNKLWNTLKTLQ